MEQGRTRLIVTFTPPLFTRSLGVQTRHLHCGAMRAELNGAVIAEATPDQVVNIEGNWYFAPEAVHFDFLTESPTPYTCAWKGACQYYTVTVQGQRYPDRAWSYPVLNAGAAERVGRDFAGYVAFWKEVSVN